MKQVHDIDDCLKAIEEFVADIKSDRDAFSEQADAAEKRVDELQAMYEEAEAEIGKRYADIAQLRGRIEELEEHAKMNGIG